MSSNVLFHRQLKTYFSSTGYTCTKLAATLKRVLYNTLELCDRNTGHDA